jgi:hypothetical protein
MYSTCTGVRIGRACLTPHSWNANAPSTFACREGAPQRALERASRLYRSCQVMRQHDNYESRPQQPLHLGPLCRPQTCRDSAPCSCGRPRSGEFAASAWLSAASLAMILIDHRRPVWRCRGGDPSWEPSSSVIRRWSWSIRLTVRRRAAGFRVIRARVLRALLRQAVPGSDRRGVPLGSGW